MDQPGNAIRVVGGSRTERFGSAPPNFVKVFFEFTEPDWPGPRAEALWAIKIEGKGQASAYQLQNTPFFAQGVSVEDIVEAEPRPDGSLVFKRVLEHFGHSTFHIFAPEDSRRFPIMLIGLEQLGCTYEHDSHNGIVLCALDVPPRANFKMVRTIIEAGESDETWTAVKAHIVHSVETDSSAPEV